jgi:amidase
VRLKSKGFLSSTDRSRRKFIRSTLVGSTATAMLPALSGARELAPAAPAEVRGFELDEATISDLQQKMASGQYTSRSITEKYLARIEEVDKNGPNLNSVIEVNPEALAISEGLDRERAEKRLHGPMHGIPVLIKDNIDTGDKMMTTAGSLALEGTKAPKDAFIVKKLREAGAVILGKTNLSEWANIRSSHSISGWSGRGGQTKNPYALDRNPCGSSSGSGAAASANLCVVAVGTETDGSVVCPSNANGLVGIKPTLGLASRSGIIPISHSQDTPGPMARTVRDAAILLSVMAGTDPSDKYTTASSSKAAPDYTKFLDPSGLKGARIGVARKLAGFNETLDKIFEEAIKQIKAGGAVIVDPADIPTQGKFGDTELTVLLYELKADLNAYLAGRPDADVHSLQDVIDFNERNRSREMPYFGQDLFVQAQAKGPLTEKEYFDALEANHRLSRKEGIDAVMDQHKLDALIAPTASPAWLTDVVDGDHASGDSSSAPAVAGYPHITVPAGFVFGMPFGLSFFGRAWSEPILIKLAFAYEQMTKARKAPRFLSTVQTIS